MTDLESANGTYVNRVRVRSAALRDRDHLQLGACVFWFLAGADPADRPQGE
jgi:pSer/pThr/pTyr-binding forkhead associated (FHA) protein